MNANIKIANAGVNKAPGQYPVWMAQAAPVKAQRPPVQAQGMDMVAVPRILAVGAAVAAMVGTLAFGVLVGYTGAQRDATTAQTNTVAYTAPTNVRDDQHGPLRAPNQAEMQAYGMALETAYGTCSLEWHGTEGGQWKTVCLGPNSK